MKYLYQDKTLSDHVFVYKSCRFCLSQFLTLKLFRQCGMFCFSFYYLHNIVMFSVHYAKIVAMVENVVLDLLPYYTSLTCSIHSSMLVIINSWQYYHLLLPCYASIKRSNDLRVLVFIYYWQ